MKASLLQLATVSTTAVVVVVFTIVMLPLATLGEEVSMDTQDEQPHMHGVTNQQWSDLSSLLSTIPEEWPNPSESSSSSSSDEEDSREASSSSTLPSVCNYNEACPELGSRCVRGYETCFGKTYHSFICDCAENDTGDLVYDCDFTDACAGASSSASSSSSSGDQHVTETT
eukprot:CAMPEP_0201651910 /NCGR_PEP_ID=MMETSP0493-20130528/43880_1 /ASSEMBLY_ACC=CAM_ASM_000838 /TAXON_ID=420259 /ORGANISM="Thalassiosira gravida, Strain GMp14c1" /LENGTH=170 /DNA_ID=CAMNT_0048128367 /DNA_START=78 /DNA_END=587 /DNA_ORIENTATION=-